MALLDDLPGVSARARDWVATVESALSDRRDKSSGYFLGYASELGVDPDLVLISPMTPPFGVHSVGVIATGDGWYPGMLVMRSLAPQSSLSQAVPATSFPSLADFLANVGSLSPAQVNVIGIDPPGDQYESVHGDLWGTLGLPVRFADGTAGALTAGHVAKKIGNSVTVGKNAKGRVVYSDHRYNYKIAKPCADVAAIELPPDWKHKVTLPKHLVLGEQRPFHTFEAYNRSGTGAGGRMVRFAGDSFKVSETEGAWGNFAMTDPISVEGDSGAIVVDEDGVVAGQVVGGLPGGYSITQVIQYLLTSANVMPDL